MIDFARMILHILNRILPSVVQPHLFLPPADPNSYPVGRGPPEKNLHYFSDVLKKPWEKFSVESLATWTLWSLSKLFKRKWGTCHMVLLGVVVVKSNYIKVILEKNDKNVCLVECLAHHRPSVLMGRFHLFALKVMILRMIRDTRTFKTLITPSQNVLWVALIWAGVSAFMGRGMLFLCGIAQCKDSSVEHPLPDCLLFVYDTPDVVKSTLPLLPSYISSN